MYKYRVGDLIRFESYNGEIGNHFIITEIVIHDYRFVYNYEYLDLDNSVKCGSWNVSKVDNNIGFKLKGVYDLIECSKYEILTNYKNSAMYNWIGEYIRSENKKDEEKEINLNSKEITYI